eukprot:3441203-Amphidinium_carterae.1
MPSSQACGWNLPSPFVNVSWFNVKRFTNARHVANYAQQPAFSPEHSLARTTKRLQTGEQKHR